ncbi:MAG TPA: RodZ domain-containing protein, partial [Phenylobacterium sp.]|nr:RodZ domain-containing protein [Phenylobacterium sp.]
GKIDSATPTRPKPISEAPAVDLASLPQTFQVKGKVYDAGPAQPLSPVIIQALKPASLIVRGADGSVYFARQLSAGDAYKIPNIAGLTLDVSEPRDIQVFVGGQTKGVLPSAQVLAAKLATPTAAAAPPSEPIKITPPMPAAPAPKPAQAAAKPAPAKPAAKAP